jgi:hypothetical protein
MSKSHLYEPIQQDKERGQKVGKHRRFHRGRARSLAWKEGELIAGPSRVDGHTSRKQHAGIDA